MQTFYNGVTKVMRSIIDTAAGGTLMSKPEDEACNLTKEMMLNNCQWSNEMIPLKKTRCKFDVDALTLLMLKLML